jgi:hypothetical protein
MPDYEHFFLKRIAPRPRSKREVVSEILYKKPWSMEGSPEQLKNGF